MKIQIHQQNLKKLWRRYSMLVLMLAGVICASVILMDRADALYILTGVEDSAIVLDQNAQVPDLSNQLVYVSTNASGFEVTLASGQAVMVYYNGTATSTTARGETISQLLSRLNIVPGPLDMIGVDFSASGTILTVASELTFYQQATEDVAYQTSRVANPTLAKGTERVKQAGVNGTRTAVYEVVYSGGEQVSRQFVEERNCTTVNEIVEYGTAVTSVSSSDRISNVTKNSDGSGYLTFKSGATMTFSAAKSMKATAYTKGTPGVDSVTATGTIVNVGTVAVDKNVIPLGTRMYIVTNDGKVVYGMAVAADTGVKGNLVDLYYNTYQQCINFGCRSCTVYVLK